MADTPEVTPQEAQKRIQNGALLLDVREQNEYDEERIPGAQLLPLTELTVRYDELPRGREIIAQCRSGKRSAQATEFLRDQGYDVTVNVVGLGLSREDRRRIRRLATLGGGSYFDAQGAGQLDEAIATAVSAPYEVRDASGLVVARGFVNGKPLELPPGTYRVTVLTDPPWEFEAVLLGSDDSATLTLPAAP